MKDKLLNFARFLVGWPISIASILFLLKFLPNLNDSLSKLRSINYPIILLSVLFFELYFFLRGLLWQEIINQKGYNVSFRNALFLWSFSELKRYTPGNIWSFLSRVFLFNNVGVKTKDTVHALIIEGETIIISSFLVSLLSLNFLFSILPQEKFKDSMFTQPLILAGVIIVSLLFIFSKKTNLKNVLPGVSTDKSLRLLLLCLSSLVSFGTGSYFAGSSIFYLNPHNFSSFVGFFVFSLLVGYLSIITPMGLGVREGVITFILSKIMSLSSATFIAIFSRLIFVISEAIFLVLSYLIYSLRNKVSNNLFSFITSHKQEVILSVFIVAYFVYFTAASFLRYDAFFTGRFDLGNMDQTVWNTIHGRIFQLTNPNGTNIISRLAFHADFLLILISPLYWIWSNPKMLLLLQSIVVPLGTIFVFLLSKMVLKNKVISLAFSIAYLFNPAVNHANLYDFHPVVIGTTFLFAAFYFLKIKRYIPMLIFLFLAAISKENVWIITSLVGLYLVFIEKKKILGSMVFVISLAVFYTLFFIIIPKEAGGQHFALSYYSEFGDSPETIVRTFITSPLKIMKTILGKDQLIYLFQLFSPLGFLPLLAPLYLVFTIPTLLIDLLSNNSQLHKIYYQYSASITPFIFIGTIYAVSFLKNKIFKVSFNYFAIFILVSTLIAAYNFGPLIGSKNPNISMFTEDLTNEKLIDRFLQRIPKRYDVAATNEVGSHLSHRQLIYTVPLGIDRAEIIVMLNNSSFSGEEIKLIKQTDAKLLSDPNYFVVYRDSQFIVFKRKGLRRSFYYF